MWYTNYMAQRLAIVERNNTRFYAMAQEDLNSADPEADEYCDFLLHTEILIANTTIPVIITNDQGGVDSGAKSINKEKDTYKV